MTYRCWDCCGEEFRESPSQHDRRVHGSGVNTKRVLLSGASLIAGDLRQLADAAEAGLVVGHVDVTHDHEKFETQSGPFYTGVVHSDWSIRVRVRTLPSRTLPAPVIDRDPGDEA
jgi:hypothetical protein